MLFLLSSLFLQATAEEAPHFLYFILVDRFHNGKTNNDGIIDLHDPAAFHGGDLQGIEQKLDYLQDMGVDALWLSPIFTMRTEKFHGHSAFHGYWVQHLDSIEPRFGGDEALFSLSSDMNKRDMGLIMDMVYNHVSFDSPMVTAHPDWFHKTPSIEDWNDAFQLTNYQVHGLPDLNQSRPPVYQYLLHRSLYWKEKTHISGIRIDAIRHLDNDFLFRLSTDLDTWTLGEDFNGNPIALKERASETGLDALFDFPLYYALTSDICDKNEVSQIASILSMDQFYPGTLQLVRFLDNHDLPRILSRCHDDKGKVRTAIRLLFSISGIPMLSYGTESWNTGATEPANRSDFQWQNIDQQLVTEIKTLQAFRRKYPVLEKGTAEIILYDKEKLIIQQRWNGTISWTLLNLSKEKFDISLPQNSQFIAGWNGNKSSIEALNAPLTTIENIAVFVFSAPNPKPKSAQLVNITWKAPTEKNNAQYYLVGSFPETGGWNPEKGIPLQYENGMFFAKVTLPTNDVLSYKIVEEQNSSFIWEKGENHFLWIQQLEKYDD